MQQNGEVQQKDAQLEECTGQPVGEAESNPAVVLLPLVPVIARMGASAIR